MIRSASSTGEALWFLDTLVTIRVSGRDGSDGVSVLEHRAPHADSAPMHVHRTEDEIFHLLEGRLRLAVDGAERHLDAGEIVLVPRGVPHTYRVESPDGARWLTITAGGGFEAFVREMARPAERPELPPRLVEPAPAEVEALTAAAARHGIEIVGPPLD